MSDKFTYNFKQTIDYKNKTITHEFEDALKRLTKEVVDTKNKAVREALIKLGWTPPPE